MRPVNPHGVEVIGVRAAGEIRPTRSKCGPCGSPIQWDVDRWTAAKVGVAGRSPECAARPGDDG